MAKDRQQRHGRYALVFVGALMMAAGVGVALPQDGAGLGPLVLPTGDTADTTVEVRPGPPASGPDTSLMSETPEVAPVGATGTIVEPVMPTTSIEPVTEPATDAAAAATPAEAPDALFSLSEVDAPVRESRWSDKVLPGAGTAPEVGELGISGEGASEAFEVGASLAGVILLIWVLRYLIRRSRGDTAGSRLLAGGRAPSGVASILARYPIARGHQVVLLEVGQRILVTHQSAGNLTTLSEITEPEELADLRARIAGVDRTEREQPFDSALTSSLEKTPTRDALSSVEGLPGMVAETVDLTRPRPRARLFRGGAA
jgi:flagellar biogenesis protein FliO